MVSMFSNHETENQEGGRILCDFFHKPFFDANFFAATV